MIHALLSFSAAMTILNTGSVVSALCIPTETPASIQAAFQSNNLVPGVVSSFNPTLRLDVVYDLSNSTNEAIISEAGVNLTVPQVASSPQWFIPDDTSSLAIQTFMIVMIDPDAPFPSNTSLSDIRHFIGPNYKLSTSGSFLDKGHLLVNSTPAISEYFPPGPPAGSAPHRYTFLLYSQPASFPKTTSSLPTLPANIENFNLTAFEKEFGLGAPIAGNFMYIGPLATSASANSTASTTATGGLECLAVQSSQPHTSGAGPSRRIRNQGCLGALFTMAVLSAAII